LTKYLRIFLLLITFGVFLQAKAYDLRLIQGDFYNKVVLEPLYNKYYLISIEKKCKNKSQECYGLSLSNFMQKKHVRKIISKRDSRFILDDKYLAQVEFRMRSDKWRLRSTQFVTIVDLSKQIFAILLWDNDEKTLKPVGFDFIASGAMEREREVKLGEDHFLKTPTGFFPIVSGWRSQGKVYGDKVTMPYGKEDRFVFFFGMQKSIRYNTFKNGKKMKSKKDYKLITDKLNFAIHTHISTRSLGIPASHGCVRMSHELNVFLDNNLVFFKHLYRNGGWIHPYKKPPSSPKNHELAGEYMLIIDKI